MNNKNLINDNIVKLYYNIKILDYIYKKYINI